MISKSSPILHHHHRRGFVQYSTICSNIKIGCLAQTERLFHQELISQQCRWWNFGVQKIVVFGVKRATDDDPRQGAVP